MLSYVPDGKKAVCSINEIGKDWFAQLQENLFNSVGIEPDTVNPAIVNSESAKTAVCEFLRLVQPDSDSSELAKLGQRFQSVFNKYELGGGWIGHGNLIPRNIRFCPEVHMHPIALDWEKCWLLKPAI